MLTHVEGKHWYTQIPFARWVEVVLVLALLGGTAFAASQVGSRDAAIADQASQLRAVTAQQQAMADVLTWAVTYHERVAALDGAIIEAYDLWKASLAMEQMLRPLGTEPQQGDYDLVVAEMNATESRIERLLAQRRVVLTSLAGYEAQ